MSRLLRVGVAAAAIAMSGCAIHPLPEDFSGVPTTTIVKQIRCETRQAVIQLALGWLTDPENLDLGRVDRRSRDVGLQFARQQRPIQQFHPKLFSGHAKEVVQLFYETGVAYNFDLEMTEVNNLNTEINLLRALTGSTFTLGIKARADRSRKNERFFTITDTFSSLVRLRDNYCSGASIGQDYNHHVPPNYAYPITGQIGVRGMIMDFINMTIFESLAGPKDAPGKPPTLVDALEFQTIIGGSLAPKIVFAPVGTRLQVSDASLFGEVLRTDLHKITMGLAVDEGARPALAAVRSYPFAATLISARPTTSAEARAAEAVNQALTLKLFRPTLVVP